MPSIRRPSGCHHGIPQSVRCATFHVYGPLCCRASLCKENTTINNRLIIINIISLYRLVDCCFCWLPYWWERLLSPASLPDMDGTVPVRLLAREKNSRPVLSGLSFLTESVSKINYSFRVGLCVFSLHSEAFYKVFPHVLQIDVPAQVKFDIILCTVNMLISILWWRGVSHCFTFTCYFICFSFKALNLTCITNFCNINYS